jgi:hypothetical protein
MPWRNWKPTRRMLPWLLLTGSVTACSPIIGNQYFCPPTIAHDQQGAIRRDVYAVDRACYKSLTEKMKACYRDAR